MRLDPMICDKAGFVCELPAIFHRPHIAGIGGIGTSGIALILLDLAGSFPIKITGSDLRQSELTSGLELRGVDIRYEVNTQVLSDASCLIIPAGFPADHPEISAAGARKIPILTRTQALAAMRSCFRSFVLSLGTLSRAKCARMAALCSDWGYCAGAAARDSMPHARYAPDLIADADERDILSNPALLVGLNPSAVLISDWQAEDLGYYSHDESMPKLIDLCHSLHIPVYYPVSEGDLLSEIKVSNGTDEIVMGVMQDTDNADDRAGAPWILVPPKDFGMSKIPVSGTCADIEAAAVALCWAHCAQKRMTPPGDMTCIGWFERFAPRGVHDIRMHPVSIRQSLQSLVFRAHGEPVWVFIKPFVSTLHAYDIHLWQNALSKAQKTVIISPPYEGCSVEDCVQFCQNLNDTGCHAQMMSCRQAQFYADEHVWQLWIGAPDIISGHKS